ncbi:hypothetical protein [Tenacibaculum sp. UWU-22]|uniref:hypothetical protein n=1 Tax=Tenacibaculum sp. UWU-22 TaxID=3234187 RepID=UPI0034DB7394
MSKFEPIPEDFMNVIFGDVYKKLTNGGDPKMLGPNNFVQWEPVATVIDEDAFDYAVKGVFGIPPKKEGMSDEEYNDLRASSKWGRYAQSEEFARLADQIPSYVPKLNGEVREFSIFSPEPDHTVSNVYADILDFSVVKNSKTDPKVEKKLELFRKKLFKTKKLKNPDFDPDMIEHPEDNPKYIYQSFMSPMYVKYLEYETLYEEAEQNLTDLQIRIDSGDSEAMTEMAINGRNIIRKRDNALKRWETLGYKGKVEKIMNYIDEVEASNFITVKKRYESEFLAAKRTGLGGNNTYYYSAPIPASILENSKGWTKFTFKKSKYESTSRNKSHSWSAKASYFGVASVNSSGKISNMSSEFNFNDFEMSFMLSKCYVSRPWLGSTLIKSRFWKYSKTGNDVVNNQMVSDGKGDGLMPAIVTELYFVKDLKIGFRKGSDSYKKAEKHIKAGGGFRFGPFNLGGNYSYDDTKIDASKEREEQGVASSEILLIGRKCNLLPLAPNPLPSIKDDEWVEVN